MFQNGIYVKEVSIGNVNIKNLYLKCNDKLSVSIETLFIKSPKTQTKANTHNINPKVISKLLYPLVNLFESISIEHITYQNTKGSLYYTLQNGGVLHLASDIIDFNSTLHFYDNYFVAKINSFTAKHYHMKSSGVLIISPATLQSFAKMNIHINNDANLTLCTLAGLNTLHYKIISPNPIHHPKQILSLFKLPKKIQYWAHDAYTLDSLKVHTIKGKIFFDNPAQSYKLLYINATASHVTYTYNKKLQPVIADTVNLIFKNGTLFIYPKEGKNYDITTQKSWLKIDLTPQKELLTIYLDLNAKLNKNIVTILKAYNITIPIEQKSGNVLASLILTIHLHHLHVDAQGNFSTKQGVFHYLGKDIAVENLHVKLDNTHISAKKMVASVENKIKANINFDYDTKTKNGTIDLEITNVNFAKDVKLQTLPLHAVYALQANKHDTLEIKQSQWKFQDLTVALEPLHISLDHTKQLLTMDTVAFHSKKILDGIVGGTYDFNTSKALLNIDLFHCNYKGIQLTQADTQFTLSYDKDFTIASKDPTLHAKLVGTKILVKGFNISLKNSTLYTKHPAKFYFGNFTQTNLFAKYNFMTQKAHFNLRNLLLKNPNNGNIIYKKKALVLTTQHNKKSFELQAKNIATSFLVNDHKWTLQINNLKKLYRDAPLLQRYAIDNGSLRIYKYNKEESVRFTGRTNYRYKIFKTQDNNITNYRVKGEIKPNREIFLHINNHVVIHSLDEIDVKIDKYDIALPEIFRLLKDYKKSATIQPKNMLTSKIEATHSNLYLGDKRYALADTITMQLHNNLLTAQLTYKKGVASMQIDGDKFHVYGKNFDDDFMEHLFRFSKFEQGSLDFNIEGTFDKHHGVFYLRKTRMLNYTILNNLFAFLNTVPALITFSVPQYSKKGIFINNAYMKYNYSDNVYHVSDFYIDSPTIQISAKGEASTAKDTIEMDMTLKTNIGNKASKIPVVGYIIFDGKSVATTVEITGKLSDPTIKSKIAQEVIVAPLNIIKRTLELPLHIFEKKKK